MVSKPPPRQQGPQACVAVSPESSFRKSRRAYPAPLADSMLARLIFKGKAGAMPCHLRDGTGHESRGEKGHSSPLGSAGITGCKRAGLAPSSLEHVGHMLGGKKKKRILLLFFFFLQRNGGGGWMGDGMGTPALREAPGTTRRSLPAFLTLSLSPGFPQKPGNSCFPSLTPGKTASSSFPHELLAGLFGQCCLTLPTPSEAVGTCQLVLPAWSTHLWHFCNYSSPKAGLCWCRNRPQQPAHKDESQLHPFSPSLPKLADLES